MDTDYEARMTRNRAQYSVALAAGDAGAAERVIEEVLSRPCSLGAIYDQVIGPALVNVGDSWCRGDINVAEEHLATQIATAHLDRLNALFVRRERRLSYRVLVACVQGELHCVGARMFADLCRSRGWSVDFLGADVPDDALIEMAHKRRPQLVGLSATLSQGVKHARRVVRELSLTGESPLIIFGGCALAANPIPVGATATTQNAQDVCEGIDIALRFLHTNRPKVVLKEYLLALGRRVRDLRLHNGWTQKQLAERTRVTRVCIVAVEGGKQNVSMDIVIRLANALNVTPEILLAEDGEQLQVSGR